MLSLLRACVECTVHFAEIILSFQAEASVRPDVDFVATMANYIQHRLHHIVQMFGVEGMRSDNEWRRKISKVAIFLMVL